MNQPWPGTPAERVAALLQAVKDGKAQTMINDQPVGLAAVLEAVGVGWKSSGEGEPAKPRSLSSSHYIGALEHKLGKRIAYNELKMIPEIDGEPIEPQQLDSLYMALAKAGWKIPKTECIDGLIYLSHQNPVHPVRRYLEKIENDDSIEPIDLNAFGPEFFGVTDTLQARFLRLFLLGAVTRVMEPGCDFKTCVVLHSAKQTMFKSLSLRTLAGEDWFIDTSQDSEKDLLLGIHSCWIYELAEIETLTGKKAAGRLKNLLSSVADSFRAPYARGVATMKRPSVFVGTCNRDDFLTDSTGNTRFLIVNITERLDYKKIGWYRDAIWKAAMLAYRAGEKPWLSEVEMAASERTNEAYTAQHEWEETLGKWIENVARVRFPHGFTQNEALLDSKIRESCADLQVGRDSKAVAEVLKSLGCTRDAKTARRPDGARTRFWHPPSLSRAAQLSTAPAAGFDDTPKSSASQASPPSVSSVTPTIYNNVFIDKGVGGGTGEGNHAGREKSTGVTGHGAVTGAEIPSSATDLSVTGQPSQSAAAGPPVTGPVAPAESTGEAQTHCSGFDVPDQLGSEPPSWLPQLLELKAAHPNLIASQLALKLDDTGARGIKGRHVKEALKRWGSG